MSSKSNLIFSSYTVSKLVRFFSETQCKLHSICGSNEKFVFVKIRKISLFSLVCSWYLTAAVCQSCVPFSVICSLSVLQFCEWPVAMMWLYVLIYGCDLRPFQMSQTTSCTFLASGTDSISLLQGVYKFNQANFQESSRRFQEGF